MDEIAEFICKEWSEVRVACAVGLRCVLMALWACGWVLTLVLQISMDDIKTVDREKK